MSLVEIGRCPPWRDRGHFCVPPSLLFLVPLVLHHPPAGAAPPSSPPLPPIGTHPMSFFQRLSSRSASADTLLCVGLDPHINELGLPADPPPTEAQRADAAYDFCKRIVDATHEHVACYKPNAAFFEALGTNLGCSTLRRVIDEIPDGIPVLLDVKRGDIGSTAAAYAEACYDETTGLKADGVTLSPLMGWDSVRPFVTGA